MAAAPQYNIWQYRRISRFVGRRVCEIARYRQHVRSADPRSTRPPAATDPDPYYRDILQQRFLGHPGLRVEPLTLRMGAWRRDSVSLGSTRSSPST